jgi:hypothetical protein
LELFLLLELPSATTIAVVDRFGASTVLGPPGAIATTIVAAGDVLARK